nr:MAG TPA: hypothetical protein [Caudoviricetes sp.]
MFRLPSTTGQNLGKCTPNSPCITAILPSC